MWEFNSVKLNIYIIFFVLQLYKTELIITTCEICA